jgi:hypothetical protein
VVTTRLTGIGCENAGLMNMMRLNIITGIAIARAPIKQIFITNEKLPDGVL